MLYRILPDIRPDSFGTAEYLAQLKTTRPRHGFLDIWKEAVKARLERVTWTRFTDTVIPSTTSSKKVLRIQRWYFTFLWEEKKYIFLLILITIHLFHTKFQKSFYQFKYKNKHNKHLVGESVSPIVGLDEGVVDRVLSAPQLLARLHVHPEAKALNIEQAKTST